MDFELTEERGLVRSPIVEFAKHGLNDADALKTAAGAA